MNAPTNDFTLNGKTYQLRTRKCGKPDCKCQRGEEHGPYWYASGDYSGLKYVGKELPADVLRVLELIKTEKEELEGIRQEAYHLENAARQEMKKYERQGETIRALLHGNHADSRILQELGLDRFIVE